MNTQDLIDGLSRSAAQVSAPSPLRLQLQLTLAVSVSVLALVLAYGVDARWPQWLMTWPYAFKAGLAAAVIALAWRVWPQMLRPGRKVSVPLTILAALGLVSLALAWLMSAQTSPNTDVFQGTWRTCTASILLLALPVWWAMWRWAKAYAPVDLRRTGAWMGAVSAAVGALVYSLHCSEFAPAFIVVWYGLAIAVGSAVSAAVAPRLLRW